MKVAKMRQIFVHKDRFYEIHVIPAEDPRRDRVRIVMDGQCEWLLEISGWQSISLGSGDGVAYLWSAREVVELPQAPGVELRIVRTDEDLLLAFYIDDGWLLVCETSIRRLVGETETARRELGEIVDNALWEGNTLHVHDMAGKEISLQIKEEYLEEVA